MLNENAAVMRSRSQQTSAVAVANGNDASDDGESAHPAATGMDFSVAFSA